MAEYRVTWQIDVDAENPHDAAREALRIQRDAESIAAVFMVEGEDIQTGLVIDLGEINPIGKG